MDFKIAREDFILQYHVKSQMNYELMRLYYILSSNTFRNTPLLLEISIRPKSDNQY